MQYFLTTIGGCGHYFVFYAFTFYVFAPFSKTSNLLYGIVVFALVGRCKCPPPLPFSTSSFLFAALLATSFVIPKMYFLASFAVRIYVHDPMPSGHYHEMQFDEIDAT